MMLYLRDYGASPPALREIVQASWGGAAEEADGAMTFYIDESVNRALCARIMARTGAFTYDAQANLHEDTDWNAPEP